MSIPDHCLHSTVVVSVVGIGVKNFSHFHLPPPNQLANSNHKNVYNTSELCLTIHFNREFFLE